MDSAAVNVPQTVSGPTQSPWLKILFTALRWAGAVLVLLALAALIAAGGGALLSALFGGALIIAFFAISLLIGHFVGRSNPSGAISLFAVTYLIKVVGFAAALMLLGTPPWLDGTWFFIAAVVTVLIWQLAEIRAFARTRHQLYADPEPTHD